MQALAFSVRSLESCLILQVKNATASTEWPGYVGGLALLNLTHAAAMRHAMHEGSYLKIFLVAKTHKAMSRDWTRTRRFTTTLHTSLVTAGRDVERSMNPHSGSINQRET